MLLPPATTLGHYQIITAVGAGGMGQVFRARDVELNRDVALKVLLPEVATDPDRLARLTREAQVLASLNHSNIAAIYGFEEIDDVKAIVMEFVEGQTLAELIARGPIPLSEALSIARQIADALAAAHEQGIVHRDLKPANIKVRDDGCVKVLDFGLAKPLGVAFGGDPMKSPTQSNAITATGVIVGTAAYMSPEQAAGRGADRRSDLWSYGVVLLEMLIGRSVFTGETVSHVLASVLKTEPDWSLLPADTPESIRRLLRRCLRKDRRLRLADAADARLEIDDAIAGSGMAAPTPPRSWWWWLPWGVAATLAIGLVSAITWPRAEVATAIPIAVEMRASGGVAVASATFGSSVALSPDGSTLVFVGEPKLGARQLYVRQLQDVTGRAMPGTAGADSPFFSPDGEWVGFFADGRMKKVAVEGGAAVTLCTAPNGRGADWGDDQFIVFQPDTTGPLMRVSAAGGEVSPITSLAEGEVTQRWPQIVRGGAVLFTSNSSRTNWENASVILQQIPNGDRRVVQQGGYYGRQLADGGLVYLQQGLLFARSFDGDQATAQAPPEPVLDAAVATTGSGAAHVAISRAGTIAYLPRIATDQRVPIAWMDRAGRVSALWQTPTDWRSPQFSPDGRSLAVALTDGRQFDVWVGPWASDEGLARLTFEAGDDFKPVWSGDGHDLAFASDRDGAANLYVQRADGGGPAQRLTDSPNGQAPGSWHPAGTFLAFQENRPASGQDIMILPVRHDPRGVWTTDAPRVFADSAFSEVEPMFSPDGRWLAYVANSSGIDEIYVRPFPGPGGTWQVSSGGGVTPTWSRRRNELIYRAPTNALMVVSYSVADGVFRPETPQVWSETRVPARPGQRSFDLHPDGERVAVAERETGSAANRDHVTLITNAFSRWRRFTPSVP
jgi:serine/threonine-protein kinase